MTAGPSSRAQPERKITQPIKTIDEPCKCGIVRSTSQRAPPASFPPATYPLANNFTERRRILSRWSNCSPDEIVFRRSLKPSIDPRRDDEVMIIPARVATPRAMATDAHKQKQDDDEDPAEYDRTTSSEGIEKRAKTLNGESLSQRLKVTSAMMVPPHPRFVDRS